MSGEQWGCSLVHCSLDAHARSLSRRFRTPLIAIKYPKRSKRVRERGVNSEQVNNGGVLP